MKVLIIHPFFPDAFRAFTEYLSQDQHDIVVIRSSPGKPYLGLKILTPIPASLPDTSSTHLWARRFEDGCHRAEATAIAALSLQEEGWTPDIIWAHPGWGDTLLLNQIYPDCPILSFVEWFHGSKSKEIGFDPEHGDNSLVDAGLAATTPSLNLIALHDADTPYVSTKTALLNYPAEFRKKIKILHEGVPTKFFSRQPWTSSINTLKQIKPDLPDDVKYLTYVARGFELSRGFHSFMRALVRFQKLQPDVHAIIMGSDHVFYGKTPEDEATWREAMLKELDGQLDLKKIHWLPLSPRNYVRALFSVSSCHVYLTSPIQLSLSPLEAMSCETPIVSNNLPQVREFIKNGSNGRLVDFFDYQEIAEACSDLINDQESAVRLGQKARESIIKKVDLNSVVMPQWINMFNDLSTKKYKTRE